MASEQSTTSASETRLTGRTGARRRTPRLVLVVVAVLYVALTLAVIFRSPVITLDRDIRGLDLSGRWPGPYGFVNTYVMLGQRAPSTLAALPYLCWLSWRQRSWRPLVTLACALLLLNASVGIVKIGLGRIGPHHDPHAHALFAGGDIYPSGHTSNAVVLFGVLAYLATRHRRLAIAACVFIAGTVGLSTLYLNTHWLSDVLGGWLAGALVLLTLPTVLANVEAWVPRISTIRAERSRQHATSKPAGYRRFHQVPALVRLRDIRDRPNLDGRST